MDAINDIHHQSGWLSHHESHRDTSWPLAVIWVIGSLRLMDDRDDHLESSGALVKRNLRKHSKLTRLFSSKQWLSSNIHSVHFMILMTSFSESSRRQPLKVVDDIKKFIFGWRTACQKRHLTFLHQWICVGRKLLSFCLLMRNLHAISASSKWFNSITLCSTLMDVMVLTWKNQLVDVYELSRGAIMNLTRSSSGRIARCATEREKLEVWW